jgi:hypothetical protein
MSQINIAGDTSGSIAIAAPLVAGSNTLTLPASTGTVLTSVSPASDLPSSIKGPAFSAQLGSTQSITGNVNTKVTINTEIFDTNNNFDSTTNYRFTPTVAGYYQVNFTVMYANTTSTNFIFAFIRKNGTECGRGSLAYAASTSYPNSAGSLLVYLNGSTDYIELYAYVNTTGNLEGYTPSVYTSFSASMVRSA